MRPRALPRRKTVRHLIFCQQFFIQLARTSSLRVTKRFPALPVTRCRRTELDAASLPSLPAAHEPPRKIHSVPYRVSSALSTPGRAGSEAPLNSRSFMARKSLEARRRREKPARAAKALPPALACARYSHTRLCPPSRISGWIRCPLDAPAAAARDGAGAAPPPFPPAPPRPTAELDTDAARGFPAGG